MPQVTTKLRRLAFGFMVGLGAVSAVGAEKGWRVLRSSELKAVFGNRELADGVHFAYRFEAGGVLSGMNMGKPAHGTWRVGGGELCWAWSKPKGPEECYQVRQQGQAVRLFVEGQEVVSGTLTPLVPATSNEVKP